MTGRVPSDVVKALFHYLGAKSRFPADPPRIHRVFFEISKKTDFAEILNDFVFDTNRSYPVCSTISFALDRLQKSSLLACINPKLDQYEITDSLAGDARIEKLFTVSEQEILKQGAEFFSQEMARA